MRGSAKRCEGIEESGNEWFYLKEWEEMERSKREWNGNRSQNFPSEKKRPLNGDFIV